MRFPTMSFVVIVLAMIACLSVPGAGQTECEAIHQCGANEFCYLHIKTGYCAPCVNCAQYNRYRADNVQCATRVEDCGGCIQGYFEEILNRKEKRTLCTLVEASSMMAMSSTTLPNNPKTDSTGINKWNLAIAIGVIVSVVLLFAGAFLYRRYKYRRDADLRVQPPGDELPREERSLMRGEPPTSSDHVVNITQEIPTTQLPAQPMTYCDPRENDNAFIPTAPPSYDSLPHARTDPELAHGSLPPMHRAASESQLRNSTDTFTVTVEEPKENALQQATPFISPQGPYANSDDGEDIDNDGEVAGHHSPTLDLNDEDTTPSSWVPGRLDSDDSEREQIPDSGNSTSHSSLTDVVGSSALGTIPNYVRNFSEVSNGFRNLHSPEPPSGMDGRRQNLQSPETLVNGRRRNRHSPEPPMTTAKKSRTDSTDSSSTLSSNEDGEPCESDNNLPTTPHAASVNNATSAVSVMNNITFNFRLQQ